jgi:pimeloyl-ACP methyl ester carboxylesterase
MILKLAMLIFIFLLSPGKSIYSQIKVAFEASDGLLVVADHYIVNKTYPYILLFHQLESSRGEFREIAPKLNKLGYNCLAVDLRAGNEVNFVRNETAQNAASMRLSQRLADTKKDMIAAIDFVNSRNELPVILLGSTFSASLSLVLAKEREDVQAVGAFSPGEFFTGTLNIKNLIQGLQKPVFIGSSKSELRFVTELANGIPEDFRHIIISSSTEGVQGAKSLWETEKTHNENWLALMMFLKNLKNTQVD